MPEPEGQNDGAAAAAQADEVIRKIGRAAKERRAAQQVSDDARLEAVARLNDRNAVVEVDGDSYIAKWSDPARPEAFALYTFEAWLRSTPAMPVQVQGASGPKTLDLAKEWPRMPEARRYRGLGLYPEGEPEGVLNMWRGWAVSPEPGDCLIFKEFLLEVICNGDEDAYAYLWKWMAHGVQFPHECPRVAVVMIGKEGTGKGVFASIYGRLFGDHFTKITSRQELTGTFNEHTQNALVLFSDEAAWGGDRDETAELKSLITEPTRAIRAKYKKAYYIPNRMRFIFATNERWAINASAESRRFLVLNVSHRRMQDLDYFGALTEQMLQNGGCAALMHDLLHEDLTGFRPMAVPKTRALTAQKVQSLKLGDRTIEQWFFEAVNSNVVAGHAWPDRWRAGPDVGAMHAEYLQFCDITKKKYPEPMYSFYRQLVSMGVLYAHPDGSLELCPYSRARQIVEDGLGIPAEHLRRMPPAHGGSREY